jgi:hypothetical protein
MTDTTTTTGLAIPVITAEMSTYDAGIAYAEAGLYVGPLKRSSKHPGSRLGDDWNLQTSRDPQIIASWFLGTNDGIFLHVGRSGAWVADVDTPDNLHSELRQAIEECNPPYQSTRSNHPGRGHYIFLQPKGRMIGNGLGKLASGWGEGRGLNGVIVVAPSEHEESEGRYEWQHTGPVPAMPDYMASLLPDTQEAAETATDAQVAEFLGAYQGSERPELLDIHINGWKKKIAAGESRHSTVLGPMAGAMREAKAGYFDAKLAADTFQSIFEPAVMQPPISRKQGAARNLAEARNEWNGILAWAIGQARDAHPAETRERIESMSGPFGLLGGSATNGSTNGSTPHDQEPVPGTRYGGLTLPPSFYVERPELAGVRRWAHERDASADPVLYATLARLAGMVPHKLRIDTGVLKPASLNLFVAACGPPGSGKSSSVDVSDGLYQCAFNDFRDGLPLGSGEGMVETFFGWVHVDDESREPKKDGTFHQIRVKKQLYHNAFLVADEGQAMLKMMEKSGSVLAETIRTLWVGATAGQNNASAETRRILPKGSYSLGLFVGFQPDTIQPLLADAAGGTPQRFVYCWVVDETIPDWIEPSGAVDGETFFTTATVLEMAPAIKAEIRARRRARDRGQKFDRLDAHQDLTKAKLAAGLCLLGGRTVISDDDWRLAGTMWQTSCRVHDAMGAYGKALGAQAAHEKNVARAVGEGMAETARQEARERHGAPWRVAKNIANKVHGDPSLCTQGAVNRLLAGRDKGNHELVERAWEIAIEEGWVVAFEDNVKPGDQRPV